MYAEQCLSYQSKHQLLIKSTVNIFVVVKIYFTWLNFVLMHPKLKCSMIRIGMKICNTDTNPKKKNQSRLIIVNYKHDHEGFR